MADLIAASFKTIMLACASLLVGFVVLRTYLAPEASMNRVSRQQRWWLVGLAGTLLLVSAADMLWRIRSVLGFVNLELALNYLQNTRHGVAIVWRSGLVLLLSMSLLQTHISSKIVTLVSTLSAMGVLYTFSAISHAAAMGGLPETLLDWTHFVAASSWAGGLLALAFSPALIRTPECLVASVSRLSKLGLAAVIVLMLSGIASARLHVDSAAVLTGTSYGQALIIKNALVLLTLAIAGANRWLFLPAARRLQPTLAVGVAGTVPASRKTPEMGDARALLTALRYEAVLLAAVLTATGWLTTQPMPHD